MATIISLVLLSAILAATCGGLFMKGQHLRQECERLRAESEQQQERFERDRQEDRALIEQVRDRMPDTFKALASDTLKASNEQFLQLAGERFSRQQTQAASQLETHEKAITQLVKPLSESVKEYRAAITAVESGRKQDYGSLKKMVESMTTDQTKLRKETSNLVSALRRPDVRGQWGEIQLRRVAELAGMIDRCDFDEQVTIKVESGIQRPDMLIHLPSNRTIVVDAKTPLDAYLSAISEEDEDQRRGHFERHVEQVAAKVNELSRKEYSSAFERAPDFVVLFIPSEPCLDAAARRRPTLIETAMEKGVVIATPSTLIALLKVVALGWREEQIAANAKKISELGQELHKRVCDAVAHVGKLGGSLEAAVKAYNRFLGSLETRVIVSARRFEELGAASGTALPEQIDPIETLPREVKAVAGNDDNGGAGADGGDV